MLRIGIIGLGMAGSKMIHDLGKHPEFRVTAAADLSDEHLQAFARDYQAEIYKNVEQLCESPNVDAVYIATPNVYHCRHAMVAASHGKHIIVEKPVAVTLEEADRMIEVAERFGVKLCVCHKRSVDPPIRKMREIVASDALGRVRMIHNWHYSDWLYRPRTPDELKGGGVVLRQGAHQFDMIRYIGGGLVKSVRASVGVWDPGRHAEGSYTAFMEFADGTAATSVYNGYGHFLSSELTYGIGADGQKVDLEEYGKKKKLLAAKRQSGEETAAKSASGYQGGAAGGKAKDATSLPHFGLTVVSCERGDIRQSPHGLYVYDEAGVTEVPLDAGFDGMDELIREFYSSVVHNTPLVHDGRWGKANLELSLAVLESSEKNKEIYLSHQIGLPQAHGGFVE